MGRVGSWQRWVGSLTACGLFLTLVTVSAPAQARLVYVALGDSYASGVGTREYIDDGSDCLRSNHAYPKLDADRIGASFSFQACSGARVADVTSSQLDPLGDDTSLVTLQVGGNDAGFTPVITECALPAWAADCDAEVDRAEDIVTHTLPGRLDSLYSTVRAQAPYAAVVVVGYPRLFMGEDCNAGTFFSPHEMNRLNAAADLLNATIERVAQTHGFDFVDPTDAFIGHAVCDDLEWINGLSNPVRESYHPNRSGQTGYADLVEHAMP